MDDMVLEIMRARDERALRQRELCEKYNLPLISFSLNIAGNIKRNKLIDIIFNLGCKQIENYLSNKQLIHKEILCSKSGNTAFFIYSLNINDVKASMIELEDYNELTRLYDIDVIDNTSLKPISRTQFGKEPRTCLICKDVPYLICRGNRCHSIDEIRDEIDTRCIKSISTILSSLARFALKCELSTTPKPGLVDRLNNGSHSDMNYNLFLDSIDTIIPYLEREYQSGFTTIIKEELFLKMKTIGLAAEREMLLSTNGINTHKGAFFSLSTIGCAICFCISHEMSVSTDNIRLFAKEFGEWAKDHNDEKQSHGKTIRANIGSYGIYEETISGYLSVFSKCSKYLTLFKKDEELKSYLNSIIYEYRDDEILFNKKIEPICIRIMCTLLSSVKDSNIIYRGGLSSLNDINSRFNEIDNSNYSYKELREILFNEDKNFIENNLSPGGVADLLSIVIFTMSLIALDILE